MHIDKVIFSVTDKYVDYWNINSKVWKNYMKIQPVCVYFGKSKLDDTYGEVVYMNLSDNLPKLFQVIWSKFFYASTQKNDVCIIGDIDQIPLQKYWFCDMIANISENSYVHLNAYSNGNILLNGPQVNGGCDLPAHYHVAKGSVYNQLYSNGYSNLHDQVKFIVDTNKYGLGKIAPNRWGSCESDIYWCAEEMYTSDMLYNNKLNTDLHLFELKHRIDRGNGFNYDVNMLKAQQYVDIHCSGNYNESEQIMNNILNQAGIL